MEASSVIVDTDVHNAILGIVGRARKIDRAPCLNDAALIALDDPYSHRNYVHYTLTRDGMIVAYASVDMNRHSIQLVVDPPHRRRGYGRYLIDDLLTSHPDFSFWAFGNCEAAQHLASSLAMEKIRQLHIMEYRHDPPQLPPLPSGIEIRPYRSDDLSDLIRVNAVAFADHPEQGDMDKASFNAYRNQPWYRDEDILVATDSTGLIGFHWMKIQDEQSLAEIYVLGVSPQRQSLGIGSALVRYGLNHMYRRGAQRVILYVAGEEDRIIGFYMREGFHIVFSDAAYRLNGQAHGQI